MRGKSCLLFIPHPSSLIPSSSLERFMTLQEEVEALAQPEGRVVVIALFEAEEPGYFQTPGMGSIRFYEDQRLKPGFHAALIMDLVGHAVPQPTAEVGRLAPQFGQLLFLTGAESHAALPGV